MVMNGLFLDPTVAAGRPIQCGALLPGESKDPGREGTVQYLPFLSSRLERGA